MLSPHENYPLTEAIQPLAGLRIAFNKPITCQSERAWWGRGAGEQGSRQARSSVGRGTTVADMIEIKHLNKYFGDLHVLKDVSLNVREGEKLVVIGPSGSGKSTLIRCVNWLEEPTSGEVIINGTPLTRKNHMQLTRTYTSMVFQQFNLYPNMTVLGNLTLAPIKLQKKSREEATKTAMENLERGHTGGAVWLAVIGAPLAAIRKNPRRHVMACVMVTRAHLLDKGISLCLARHMCELRDEATSTVLKLTLDLGAALEGKVAGLRLRQLRHALSPSLKRGSPARTSAPDATAGRASPDAFVTETITMSSWPAARIFSRSNTMRGVPAVT